MAATLRWCQRQIVTPHLKAMQSYEYASNAYNYVTIIIIIPSVCVLRKLINIHWLLGASLCKNSRTYICSFTVLGSLVTEKKGTAASWSVDCCSVTIWSNS